jgi:multidrug resistance efflux pump
MSEINKIEIRSEEVQEILGRPPRWILRWGITLLFSVIILLFVGSWFFKYPDIIQSTISVTTENIPANLVAKSSGKITGLYAKDNEIVKKGQVIAVIENSASTNDIIFLKNILSEISNVNWLDTQFLSKISHENLILGDVETSFSSFRLKLEDYIKYTDRDYSGKKIKAIQNQLEYYNGLVGQMQKQVSLQNEDQDIANGQFKRDSLLFAQKVLSETEYETSKKLQLQKKYSTENAKTSLTNSQIQLSQLEQQLQELEIDKAAKDEEYQLALVQLLSNLKASIAQWEQNYALLSPIDGKLTFSRVWSIHQNVTSGELVVTVIPSSQGEIMGILKLPIEGSGKVKIGQKVNVKFLNYPYMEFGMVIGKIQKISMVPNDNNYLVEVVFPNGLKTNYGKKLNYLPEMTGSAEIITEDLRLIERLFNPIRAILKKNL